MDESDAIDGAKELAASLEGPFGRRKFLPVVEEHLDYFRRARASGASWAQIVDVLRRAGVLMPDGKPYPADMLRAVVSRAERASQTVSTNSPPAFEPSLPSRRSVQAPPSSPQQRRKSPAVKTVPASPTSTELGEVRDRIQRAARLRGFGGTDE